MAESSIAELFKSQGRRVRSLLRKRLGSSEDAQDVAQDVFLGVLQREREGAFVGDPRAYLARAVRNAAIDVERWRTYHRPDAHAPLDDEIEVGDEADVGDALFWRDALHRLVDALNELPKAARQTFILYHVEGQSHAAIARRLHMSLRTVERHMARAMAHCEARLKEYLG